jgi:hypothetical protein
LAVSKGLYSDIEKKKKHANQMTKSMGKTEEEI